MIDLVDQRGWWVVQAGKTHHNSGCVKLSEICHWLSKKASQRDEEQGALYDLPAVVVEPVVCLSV